MFNSFVSDILILKIFLFMWLGLERVSYITFLGIFDQLADIPKEKKNSQYREYLVSLLLYLHSYVERVKPLLDMGEELDSVNREFSEQWQVAK